MAPLAPGIQPKRTFTRAWPSGFWTGGSPTLQSMIKIPGLPPEGGVFDGAVLRMQGILFTTLW
jgi:hypothetical protein